MRKENRGFTLVEIIIVVTIIAILAVIAIPNLLRAKTESNYTYAKASLKSIATALENYSTIHSQYPAATSSLMGQQPPYLTTDYFASTHYGYSFTATLSPYTYLVVASPTSTTVGLKTFTMTTGGLITSTP